MKTTAFKNTDIGPIPEDWEVMPLGAIGEPLMCKRVLKSQTSDCGDVPFYKISTFGQLADAFIPLGLFEEFKRKYSYPNNGDILLSAAGTIGRKVVFDGHDSYFQDSNIVWIANDERKVLNSFLFWWYEIIKWNTEDGGIVTRLYNNNLKSSLICVPPLPEQRRIAAALSDADELVASLDKLIEKKKRVKEGAMQRLLSGETRLPGFTGKWIEKRLGDCSSIARGGSPRPIDLFLTTEPTGINWIKIGDVGDDAKYVDSTSERIIAEGASHSRFVSRGDLILSNSMSYGRPYILKIDGCIHDGWLVIQKFRDTFDTEFLYYGLRTSAVTNQYQSLAAGSSVHNLNKELVEKVVVLAPPTLSEQRAIAAVLSDMDAEIAALSRERAEAERVRA